MAAWGRNRAARVNAAIHMAGRRADRLRCWTYGSAAANLFFLLLGFQIPWEAARALALFPLAALAVLLPLAAAHRQGARRSLYGRLRELPRAEQVEILGPLQMHPRRDTRHLARALLHDLRCSEVVPSEGVEGRGTEPSYPASG